MLWGRGSGGVVVVWWSPACRWSAVPRPCDRLLVITASGRLLCWKREQSGRERDCGQKYVCILLVKCGKVLWMKCWRGRLTDRKSPVWLQVASVKTCFTPRVITPDFKQWWAELHIQTKNWRHWWCDVCSVRNTEMFWLWQRGASHHRMSREKTCCWCGLMLAAV